MPSRVTKEWSTSGRLSAAVPFLVLLFACTASAQRVAVLAPDGSGRSLIVAAEIEKTLDDRMMVEDSSLARAAFNAASHDKPFNLTIEQSKALGAAIGCDLFVLVSSATLRRSSSERPEYFEASASTFAVSARSGHLVQWRLLRFEASRPERAEKMLDASIAPFARALSSKLKDALDAEMAVLPPAAMAEATDPSLTDDRTFRAPVPYRRLKPLYTRDAYLFDIAATVDIVVDLNAAGSILRTEVVRWAGFGLDESVETAVRSMNWRPAERNGKPLPMRFLVRYNFKKIDE
jgi:hypothetical protein